MKSAKEIGLCNTYHEFLRLDVQARVHLLDERLHTLLIVLGLVHGALIRAACLIFLAHCLAFKLEIGADLQVKVYRVSVHHAKYVTEHIDAVFVALLKADIPVLGMLAMPRTTRTRHQAVHILLAHLVGALAPTRRPGHIVL